MSADELTGNRLRVLLKIVVATPQSSMALTRQWVGCLASVLLAAVVYRVWRRRRLLDRLQNNNKAGSPSPIPARGSFTPGLWRVGRFSGPSVSFDVALRRDKNATMECLELVCGSDHADSKRNVRDVGYVLFEKRDVRGDTAFVLRGMQVNPEMRGRKLSKVIMAIWLHLCFEVGASPGTIPLKKPLICLVLEQFGFTPCMADHAALQVEVSEVHSAAGGNLIGLWATDMKKLGSVISKRTCKSQKMVFLSERPAYSSPVYIHTAYELPEDLALVQCKARKYLPPNVDIS